MPLHPVEPGKLRRRNRGGLLRRSISRSIFDQKNSRDLRQLDAPPRRPASAALVFRNSARSACASRSCASQASHLGGLRGGQFAVQVGLQFQFKIVVQSF